MPKHATTFPSPAASRRHRSSRGALHALLVFGEDWWLTAARETGVCVACGQAIAPDAASTLDELGAEAVKTLLVAFTAAPPAHQPRVLLALLPLLTSAMAALDVAGAPRAAVRAVAGRAVRRLLDVVKPPVLMRHTISTTGARGRRPGGDARRARARGRVQRERAGAHARSARRVAGASSPRLATGTIRSVLGRERPLVFGRGRGCCGRSLVGLRNVVCADGCSHETTHHHTFGFAMSLVLMC